MKRKILLLSVVLMLGIAASNAQNADNKWGFGVHFGVMEYNGDFTNQFYSFSQGYGVGASIARYLNPSFDVMLHFFYDGERSHDSGRLGAPTWLNFYTHMYNTNLLAKYKFNNGYLLKEDALLAPFLLAGLGGNYANSSGVNENGPFAEKFLTPDIYAGVGLNLRISPVISIVAQTALMYPFTDKVDGIVGNTLVSSHKGNDWFLQNSVGLYISPGKAKIKDADGDGVADKLDQCPDTPAGVPVGPDGCPLDTDNDGIYDYLDDCPQVAGLKQFNGCPDTDGDGIPDKLDECPEVAGLAALKGCPDSDGDGVADKDDKCPDTPRGYKVDRFGCPLDSDKDGIPDSEDACPDVPGVPELKGCPYDVKIINATYNLLMEPILFDFDSYQLKPAGVATLDKISKALSNHKGFGVQLDGHTDYVGTEIYNLGLSEKRANSAKDYLINRGIDSNRFRLQFFGETMPAQNNMSIQGREMNRRVEYILFELNK